ncbi:MAG: zinc ABC transporter substrate-binding protein [Paracoccus sp. (in: a-proteobacteria)]|nr:zinc ABC transporter substrate-binding protein [Paracoccus sp. (in: a-proteobacteria)]
MKKILIPAAIAAFATPAAADAPLVLTDIAPVDSLVRQVMGDLGEPELLLDTGANAHDFQLRPSQARALRRGDLLIWVGAELTPWLERAVEGTEDIAKLTLIDLDATHLQPFADGALHSAEHGHDHQEEGHSHDGIDPHIWLDPQNAAGWLPLIADHLAALDPDNADTYRANAEAASAEIEQLEAEIAEKLAPHRDQNFVVFHDAYGYFTDHFGLSPAIALSEGDASDPAAGRLREIQTQIVDQGAICAFAEANHNPLLISRMIEGTDVRLGGTLDPEGATKNPSAQLYGNLVGELADTIVACLSEE